VAGVVQAERERRERWAARGLPDPVQVLNEERRTRERVPDFRSPKRALLDPYFAAHPDEKPRGW
jgi:hypothetical protein